MVFSQISSVRSTSQQTRMSASTFCLMEMWVENMNSVMDDNKLLTLANGERIRLQKHCALLVEVGQCGV